MDAVRYGIIGLGQVASKGHIPSLLAIPDARIVALADTEPRALAAAKEQVPDARTYADFHALLADDEVEVALIATPNWLHLDQARAGFEAGKPVFCEKPLGVDLDECDAILAAHRKNGRLLQVGHEMRYANLMVAMRQKVRDGLVGRVQMMVLQEFRFPLLPGWRQTGRTGGVMLEKNSHFFDLFNWFADAAPVRVIGAGGNNVNKDSPLIDHCIVTVEYENEVRATLLMCLFAEHGSQVTFDIVGDKGRLIAYASDQRLVFHGRTDPAPQEWTFEKGADGTFHMGFKTQHEAFIRCVRQGEPILAGGEVGRQVMRVCLAAERAVGGEAVVPLGER